MSRLTIAAIAILAVGGFTALDHGMRLDQQALCSRSDEVPCPSHLWWFQVRPSLAVEQRVLVGLDCAQGAVIVAAEEDDPAFEGGCRTIDVHSYTK